eukprot:6214658-Pleurochrysis_carterae.AAC.4
MPVRLRGRLSSGASTKRETVHAGRKERRAATRFRIWYSATRDKKVNNRSRGQNGTLSGLIVISIGHRYTADCVKGYNAK